MKKIYLLICTAILFASCSKDKDLTHVLPPEQNYSQVVPKCGGELTYSPEVYKAINAARKAASQGGSPKPLTIFFDFDGGVCSNTSWNYAGPISYAPSGLSIADNQKILAANAAVFDTFNVAVTDDQRVFDRATFKVQINVTISHQWYGNAGGVAFIGSVHTGDPVWIFTANNSPTPNISVPNIVEASKHETGHSLGCYHQAKWDSICQKISDYRPGPMMGLPYGGNGYLTIGPGPFRCDSIQNDKAVIASNVGYKRR